MSIDPETRDVVQTVYIRRVERGTESALQLISVSGSAKKSVHGLGTSDHHIGSSGRTALPAKCARGAARGFLRLAPLNAPADRGEAGTSRASAECLCRPRRGTACGCPPTPK